MQPDNLNNPLMNIGLNHLYLGLHATDLGDVSVSQSTALYLHPKFGNRISLNNGAYWKLVALSGIKTRYLTDTMASGGTAIADATLCDVFAYEVNNDVELQFVTWTSGTVRASAISLIDGVYVKTSDITKRYIGTFQTNGAGKCDLTNTRQFLYSHYNAHPRLMSASSATAHTYTTASWRRWNNTSAANMYWVHGFSHKARIDARFVSSGTPAGGSNGATFDSVAAAPNGVIGNILTPNATDLENSLNDWKAIAAGYHYVSLVEYGDATITFSEFQSICQVT